MPLVSVIIPAYNAEKTILETIESLQEQTLSDFEIIVINDGSTDRTIELLSALSDPRLKVFSYENGGLPTARNRGISHATGEFISFIDADDLWTSDKLQAQIEALQVHPEAGVAYSWTAFINESSQFLYAWEPIYFEGDIYPEILLQNFISSGSNILVRKQFIEQAGLFDPSLKSAEDWDYYIRLAALCPFVVVPKYQILYRRSSQSMTSKVDVMEKYILQVIERAFQQAPVNLKPLKKQSLARTYKYLSQLCMAHISDQKGIKQASQKFIQAVQLYPQLLLEKSSQRLFFKILILRFLPSQVARKMTQTLKRFFPDTATQALSPAIPD